MSATPFDGTAGYIEIRPHDDKCPGCNQSGYVRDYIVYCERCRKGFQGDTQHRIQGKNYCASCADEVMFEGEEAENPNGAEHELR